MTHLFSRGLSYKAIAVARTAVCVFVKITASKDINSEGIISRFMRGIFNKRPTVTRTNTVWDVKTVLNYLQSHSDTTLLQLSCKLSMLFLLLTAQRCQSLHLIKLNDIVLSDDQIVINTPHMIKQSRPGYKMQNIVLKAYPENSALCIVSIMNEYIHRTKNLRNSDQLLITTIKPFKAASKQTVGRWIKLVLLKSGLDCSFTPHSTRSASTSFAKLKGVPISHIITTAGWANARTFARYYDKPIEGTSAQQSVADAVLSAAL